jgi:hypothetical protein
MPGKASVIADALSRLPPSTVASVKKPWRQARILSFFNSWVLYEVGGGGEGRIRDHCLASLLFLNRRCGSLPDGGGSV